MRASSSKAVFLCATGWAWTGIFGPVDAFRSFVASPILTRSFLRFDGANLLHATESSESPTSEDQAEKLRAEAERIRLEAELMEARLTLDKISSIEEKMSHAKWLENHPDEQAALEQQLEELQKKVLGEENFPKSVKEKNDDDDNVPPAQSVQPKESRIQTTKATKDTKKDDSKPISGFDESDLVLYVPVAEEIEARIPNATIDEKIEAFRSAPELQEHFQKKIALLFVNPMQDMQRLQHYRDEYLSSTSSVEKERLKREIDRLEASIDEDGPFFYSDSIYRDLPPLTEEEVAVRLKAVGELPGVLQVLYKRRCGVDAEDDLRLAIEVDHYEEQLQLLDQVRSVVPLTDESRDELVKSLDSLPLSVKDHLAKGLDLENGDDREALIRELCGGEEEKGNWNQLVASASNVPDPEYNDIEFVDRSRYIDEFFPSIARLEGQHPSLQVVEKFIADVLDRKTFMVSSKPERVIGGYYIRGNPSDDAEGIQLVQQIKERLASSSLHDLIDYFYLPDPAPLTDEQLELGVRYQPVLLVTAKNRTAFYDCAAPLTKALVSVLGLVSVFAVSVAVVELQPQLQQRLEAAVSAREDISWLITDMVMPVAVSMMAIQLAHETAHRVVAWKDKFEIGLPSPIPSIQLGLLGAITPLKSPPLTLKSMFDFSIAGPLAGLVASLVFLIAGLNMTASMDLSQAIELPGLPVSMLRSSALGGGLIELFLGNGALMQGISEDSVLPLHPFAISGFVGLVANALALLPLGNTDGGRISLAMFGRRGTYIVKTFTAILLCIVGLFGLDNSRILLSYTLFAFIWQRELEAPARNEVAELDFPRGGLAFTAAFFVALTLLPML